MSFVLVQDVSASWHRYTEYGRAIGRQPRGLILHVAGPTDEGFRIIDVWESETAWFSFRAEALGGTGFADDGAPATVRELHALNLVLGSHRPVLPTGGGAPPESITTTGGRR